MEIECTTRKWGNSIGIIIPKEIADKELIKENQKVKIIVKKDKTTFQKAFGIMKGWDIDVQKVKNELRKDWDL